MSVTEHESVSSYNRDYPTALRIAIVLLWVLACAPVVLGLAIYVFTVTDRVHHAGSGHAGLFIVAGVAAGLLPAIAAFALEGVGQLLLRAAVALESSHSTQQKVAGEVVTIRRAAADIANRQREAAYTEPKAA